LSVTLGYKSRRHTVAEPGAVRGQEPSGAERRVEAVHLDLRHGQQRLLPAAR
jgi:hypothetical protein